MTREESINNAAVQFATQFIDTGETDFYGHFVKEQGLDHAEYRGFIAGAKWADANPKSRLIDLSQVWHEAKEEPKEGTQVVAIDNDGWTVSGLFNPRAMVKGVYIYGDLVVDWYSVVRWAYIKDLLPKGGE